MAYATDSLNVAVPRVGGGDDAGSESSALWVYRSDDPKATVDGAGYIDNGNEKGLKVGDIVLVADNGATATLSIVTAIAANGDVTML